MFSCQSIALAGDRGAVEFVVCGIVVVDEACPGHDPAAGGVLECVCAGQPVTVCILEPVFYNCAESFGGKTVVPPRSADAVAHFPHAVRVVETGPGVALRFGGTGCENTDGPKHLPGGLFHNAPLIVISIRVEQRPCGQQFAGLFGVAVRGSLRRFCVAPTAGIWSPAGRWPSSCTSSRHLPGSGGARSAAPFRSPVCLHGAWFFHSHP